MAVLSLHPVIDPIPFRELYIIVLLHRVSRSLDKRLAEAVPDGYWDLHSENSPQSDIVIYSKTQDYSPAVVIEFSRQTPEISDIENLQKEMLIHKVQEAFLFCFDSEQWICVYPESGSKASAWSELLQLDMNELVQAGLEFYRK